MTTSPSIERFEREYIHYHGLSADRAVRQVRVLRAFEEHAGKPLTDCGPEEFRAFLHHGLDSGLHPNTVAQHAKMIRPYFGWAFDVGLISGDGLMAIKRVENPRGSSSKLKPRPYSQKELRAFWDGLDRNWPERSDLTWKRWRNGTASYTRIWRHAMRIQIEAITRLALDCGLRRQEIFALSIDDVHPDNLYVMVRNGKRESAREDKGREVPFTKKARVAVERWLNVRSEILRAEKVEDHGAVWLCLLRPTQTHPMRFERFSMIMGTCGPFTLHRFRHTAATHWLRAEVPLEKVSRFLGHSNLAQTLAYAELNRDDINDAMHKHEDAFERLANAEEAP